jgi:hypothetical protein
VGPRRRHQALDVLRERVVQEDLPRDRRAQLDDAVGPEGLLIARMAAAYTYSKYAKARALQT